MPDTLAGFSSVQPSTIVDPVALFHKVDVEVDQIYEKQCLLGDGLAVLREVFMESPGTHPRGAELNFMIKALQAVVDGLIRPADAITTAIEVINPHPTDVKGGA